MLKKIKDLSKEDVKKICDKYHNSEFHHRDCPLHYDIMKTNNISTGWACEDGNWAKELTNKMVDVPD